jgi:hypothetical protein
MGFISFEQKKDQFFMLLGDTIYHILFKYKKDCVRI